MPRLIDPPAAPALDLDEVTVRLDDSGVDLADEASIARCADLLAGLALNPDFLADRVIAALKACYADHLEINRYSAQVFLLHRSSRGFYLRANLWPSARDVAYATSGAAAFSYGVPHDHNFSFLTAGYFGPGYVSDYYDYDPETVDGRLGEPLGLKFVERSSLSRGKMMLYGRGRACPLARPIYRRPRPRNERTRYDCAASDADQRRDAAALCGASDGGCEGRRRAIR